MAETTSGLYPSKEYTRAKQLIAHEVRSLSEFLKQHLGEREAKACRNLMAKLADDRFTLAVVGQYKRGKSTLMNAIIGRDLLPTGMLPLTSAITVLTYGPRERLSIQKEGSLYPEQVPITDLADYVTERGNPGNKRRVVRATLEVPSPFLRRGLEFVDTPGIGSNIEANTATTYEFVPQSDAVIFVTGVDTPLTRSEMEFLGNIREHVRKVFFVVNKIDLVNEAERQSILSFVSETLERQIGADHIRLFPVSATSALEMSMTGTREGFETSGLSTFQDALCDFLAEEKNNVLLTSVMDKLLRLVGKATREMHLFKLAGETSQEEGRRTLKALDVRFEALRNGRRGLLVEARDRIVPWAREQIDAEMRAVWEDESRTVVGRMNERLSQLRWKPGLFAARDIAKQELQRVRNDLDHVTAELVEHLEPQAVEVLRQESAGVLRELQKIRAASFEVLYGRGVEVSAEAEEAGVSIYSVLLRPMLPKTDWIPKVPLRLAFLPVFAARSTLKNVLDTELKFLLHSYGSTIESKLVSEVQEAVERVGTEIEKRAAEMESHIVQAVKGRRLSKGIDGQWRLTQLDSAELAGEIEMLAEMESKLLRIRSWLFSANLADLPPLGTTKEMDPSEGTVQQGSDEVTVNALRKSMDEAAEGADFSKDCATRGCPVCNRLTDAARRFFAIWQHALATEDRAQHEFAASLGFCPLHTWQLAATASPRGLSQGLPAFMERLAADLSKQAESKAPASSRSLLSLVQSSKRCRVCHMLSDVEREYLEGLASFLQIRGGQQAYLGSQGVCLHHLGRLIPLIPSEELGRSLLAHAARRFAEISEDMQNLALKRDALSGHVPSTGEADAYMRGLIHSVGARQVCFPWELDAEF